jgi:hypothetical protein
MRLPSMKFVLQGEKSFLRREKLFLHDNNDEKYVSRREKSILKTLRVGCARCTAPCLKI